MMRKHRLTLGIFALALLATTGCGNAATLGFGIVTVDGLAEGQELLCGSAASSVVIAGKGFLSEHGIEIVVRFDAVEGTPFQGGTETWEEVLGTVLSDTLVEIPVPDALGTFEATITVILPGGNSGVSPPQLLEIGGVVLGPFAVPDVYGAGGEVIGNVTLMVDAENGVLANDIPSFCGEGEEETTPEKARGGGPVFRRSLPTVTGFDPITTEGGTVTVNPDGSFTYQPPLGLEGEDFALGYDSFTYTIEEPGQPPSTTFVSLFVGEVVWFIDSTAAPGGTGHFSDPFDSLSAFNAVQDGGGSDQPEEGDWIFIYEGTRAPYDGGIALLDDQKLIGHGVDLVVNGQFLIGAANPPVLTNTTEDFGGTCIRLGNANRIDGLNVVAPVGDGIAGFDVIGPTTVNNTDISGTGSNGIRLEGDCSGEFTFGTTVSVSDAADTGVRIGGFGEVNGIPQPQSSLPTQVFGGLFTFEGDITQLGAGAAIVVGTTDPGSTIIFQNGTIMFDEGPEALFAAIDLFEVHGSFTCTSPQTILGDPFIGIFIEFSSGTFQFTDTTIDVYDDGFSSSGVECIELQGADVTFTNLDIDIAGDTESDAGGVGIRVGNLGGSTKPHAITLPPGTTHLTVNGISTIDMIDAEDACVIFGDDAGGPINLDVTLQSVSVTNSPQTGGFFFGDCLGAFTVTGTTTITNFDSAGILFVGGDCDLTFNTLNISNGTGIAGRGAQFIDNAGMFSVGGGVWDDFTLDGLILENSNGTINNVAFSNVGIDVVELVGTCWVTGTGNTATGFGNLCDHAGATVTGQINFVTWGPCPP